MEIEKIGNNLTAWIEQMREAQNAPGTLSPCPFCQKPRSRRSDYIRCSPCGVNWLEQEMHLPNYLNRNPSAARNAARMAALASKPAEPSETDVK